MREGERPERFNHTALYAMPRDGEARRFFGHDNGISVSVFRDNCTEIRRGYPPAAL